MAKGSDKNLIVSIVMVSVVLLLALLAYVKFAPADVVPQEKEVKEDKPVGGGVRLLTPYYKDNELAFRTSDVEVPPGVDKYVFVVNQYLRSVEAVPKDALLETCTVKDGVATLDFNEAFRTTYGTDDESTLINGLLTVMGQFDDVLFVKVLIKGQKVETLGNYDLIDPQQVQRIPAFDAKKEPPKPAKS